MSAIDNYTGEIRLLAGSRLPRAWRVCDGASLSATSHPALFEQIGYRYGGSEDTFALPRIDHAGRFLRYIICTDGIRLSQDSSLGTGLMGEIRYLAGLPEGCSDALPARGASIVINFSPALFSILGNKFGGDSIHFQLPNLPGLSPANGPAISALLCVAGIYPQVDSFYSDAYVSEVRQMALNFTARGWLPCQGQFERFGANPALYSLLLGEFGSRGSDEFATPNIPEVGGVAFFINSQGIYPDLD